LQNALVSTQKECDQYKQQHDDLTKKFMALQRQYAQPWWKKIFGCN